MTKLLQKACEEASKLPEKDALVSMLLGELASQRYWEEMFAKSHDVLGKLTEPARAEHRVGRTERPDPDKL